MTINRRWVSILPFALLLMLLFAACGGSSTQQAQKQVTPTPTPSRGQQLLDQAAHNLNTAKTLHAILDFALSGQTFNGSVKTEVWNASPDKNRTVVLQSTIARFPVGSVTVSNGKQVWQYDPTKKVVYTGSVSTNSNTATPASAGRGTGGDQADAILNLVQSILTHSNATLDSSSASVNGHDAYVVHVTPQSLSANAGSAGFNYDGDVSIDKATVLPVHADLEIQGFGHVVLDFPTLVLNQPVAASLFTFVPPAGVKVLPLQQESSTSGTGTITLAQAEQQAGYHLLSIPASQTAYQLQGVDALGAPGNQIYALNYIRGATTFTISEGKPLANLPGSGQQVSLRGTTATLSSSSSSTTLTWTEHGVGIQIAGQLSDAQIEAIAKLLS